MSLKKSSHKEPSKSVIRKVFKRGEESQSTRESTKEFPKRSSDKVSIKSSQKESLNGVPNIVTGETEFKNSVQTEV